MHGATMNDKEEKFLTHDAINEEYLKKKITVNVKVLHFIFCHPIRMLLCLGLIVPYFKHIILPFITFVCIFRAQFAYVCNVDITILITLSILH